MKYALILFVFILYSSISTAESLPIHTFHTKNYKEIGKLYIELNEFNLLKSAKIKQNNEIIYTIDENGFSNKTKVQVKCHCIPFYGFVIATITNNSISVYAANMNGEPNSDIAVITWDEKNEAFSFRFIP